MKAHEKLKAYLMDNGLKAGFVAGKIGVSQAAMTSWLTARRVPSPVVRPIIEKVTGGAVQAWEWTVK